MRGEDQNQTNLHFSSGKVCSLQNLCASQSGEHEKLSGTFQTLNISLADTCKQRLPRYNASV